MISTYEIGLILSVGADEKGIISGAKKFIEKQGVKMGQEDSWGKKTLAYGIKKQTEGVYVFFTVVADGATISKVTSSLRTYEPVLRYLIIKDDGKKADKLVKKEAIKAEEKKTEDVKKEEEVVEKKKKTKSKK